MWIDIKNICDHNNIAGHMVLNCLSRVAQDRMLAVKYADGCELKILIDGVEQEITPFINSWESCIDQAINRAAQEKVEEKLNELDHVIEGIRVKLAQDGFLPSQEYSTW